MADVNNAQPQGGDPAPPLVPTNRISFNQGVLKDLIVLTGHPAKDDIMKFQSSSTQLLHWTDNIWSGGPVPNPLPLVRDSLILILTTHMCADQLVLDDLKFVLNKLFQEHAAHEPPTQPNCIQIMDAVSLRFFGESYRTNRSQYLSQVKPYNSSMGSLPIYLRHLYVSMTRAGLGEPDMRATIMRLLPDSKHSERWQGYLSRANINNSVHQAIIAMSQEDMMHKPEEAMGNEDPFVASMKSANQSFIPGSTKINRFFCSEHGQGSHSTDRCFKLHPHLKIQQRISRPTFTNHGSFHHNKYGMRSQQAQQRHVSQISSNKGKQPQRRGSFSIPRSGRTPYVSAVDFIPPPPPMPFFYTYTVPMASRPNLPPLIPLGPVLPTPPIQNLNTQIEEAKTLLADSALNQANTLMEECNFTTDLQDNDTDVIFEDAQTGLQEDFDASTPATIPANLVWHDAEEEELDYGEEEPYDANVQY